MSSEIKQLVLSLLVLLLLAACGGGPDSESPIATDGTTNAPPTNGADDDNTPPVLSDSAERGKALYNSSIQGCLGCHGADGQSGRFQKIDPTLATYEHSSVVGQGYRLEEYLELWMPVSNPSLCVGECATDIAAYMRSWNTASPEPTPEPAPAPTPNPVPSPIEIRVESEDYDRYYDTTSANEGGEYRQDDVGIGRAIDQGGGYFVGWTARDEWLEYDVTIPASGDYNLELRIATVNVVGNGVIALSIDGQSVEDTVSLPITGDWQGWTSIDIPLGRIEQGQKNIRFSIVNHGINLNWFRLHADIAVPEPTPTPIPTPAPVPVAGD
ncbi:MAG: carbohydrate-binding domain-containing protein, partial [Pseudomonadota bacterium]